MTQNEQHPPEEPIIPVPPEPLIEEEQQGNGDEESPEEAEEGTEEKEAEPQEEAEQRTEGRQNVNIWLSDRVLEYFQGMGVPEWKDRIDYTLVMFVDMGGIWSGDKPEKDPGGVAS